MIYLFFTRLFLYVLAAVIPDIHPAIVVPYDSVTRGTFQFLVPLEMIVAYFLRPGRTGRVVAWTTPTVVLLLFVLLYLNNAGAWKIIVPAGVLAYLFTRLVFSRLHTLSGFAVLETFLLGFVYYTILSYARSSEEIAKSSREITGVIFFVAIIAFLLHSIVIYLSAFPDKAPGRKRKELLVFAGIAIPVAFALVFFLPPNFVKHTIALNNLGEEAPTNPLDGQGDEDGGGGNPQPPPNTRNGKPLGDRQEKYPSELQGQSDVVPEGQGGGGSSGGDSRGGQGKGEGRSGPGGPGGSGGQGEGGGQGSSGQSPHSSGSGSGNNNRTEGVPADQWDQFNQQGGGKGKQKAVMVIASKRDPVYAAMGYKGRFDPQKGYTLTENQRLNELADRKLLETWETSERTYDLKRKPVDIFYLSTIDRRVVAYMPLRIEPTIRDVRYHPFNLSYTAKSGISVSNPEDWKTIRGLTEWEKQDLEFYLRTPEQIDTQRLSEHVSSIVKGEKGYFQRIDAVLRSFEEHQYEMGHSDTMSYDRIEGFLFDQKSGDCTEFAHTTAMLLRLAGYPTRVVSGYVASRDLQTPAHLRGLLELRKSIPLLKNHNMEEMYLVTTSHRHEWIQVFFPGYGWIDIETTSYAKPPKPENDPNNMDVVIPLIEEEPVLPVKNFQIPWKLLGIVLGTTAILVLVGLYIFRFGREIFYFLASRSKHEKRALDAIYKLFFMRLATRGYPLKEPYRTIQEYAKAQPELKDFASVYNMLRFRELYASGEKELVREQLRETFRNAMKETKGRGLWPLLRRIFSLRGLYY